MQIAFLTLFLGLTSGVQLRFPSNIVARKDLIFGGESGETQTELTAVPVDLLRDATCRSRSASPPRPGGSRSPLTVRNERPNKVTTLQRRCRS